MKECVKCGKTLGIIEGYRHPTMGKDYLLCSTCFDVVSANVEKWNEFVSPYIAFFNKESSTVENMQKIRDNISKRIKKIQKMINDLWPNNINQNINEDLTNVHQHNIEIQNV